MTRFIGVWLPRLVFAFVAVVMVPPVRPVVADPAVPVADVVDRVAQDAMKAQHLPGLVVLVADHGRATAVRAYGFADVAARVPVAADTRFEIGSITKQFTAACILQLADAHKLTLDDTVGMYVPSYTIANAVTIRQLLQQTSGIPEYLGTLRDPTEASRPVTFAALLAHVASKPLAFPPGTKWAYSNTNYALLGRIVELVSHETYERYVREHIFLPAGMTHAGFIGDGLEPAVTAHGYELDGKHFVRSLPLDETWAAGAGAIVATAADLLAWDDTLLAGTIVPPADVTLMRTSGVLASGAPTGYGFGWVIDGSAAHPRIWHNGGTFGFSATNATYPADDQIVIVLMNLGYGVPVSIASGAFAGMHPDLAVTVTPAPGEDPAVTARAREWIGRFQTGAIDRTQLTPQMDAALTPDVIDPVKAQIGPLGPPLRLVFAGTVNAPGYTVSTYLATFAAGTLRITISMTPDGKIAGYYLKPAP